MTHKHIRVQYAANSPLYNAYIPLTCSIIYSQIENNENFFGKFMQSFDVASIY